MDRQIGQIDTRIEGWMDTELDRQTQVDGFMDDRQIDRYDRIDRWIDTQTDIDGWMDR